MKNIKCKSDLSGYEVVFCDSYSALKKALVKGLPDDIVVKTTSPVLIHTQPSNFNIQPIGDSITAETVNNFLKTCPYFISDVINKLKENISDDLVRILIARQVRNLLIPCYHSFLLDESDFTEKRAVIRFSTGNEAADKRLNLPWPELLDNNPLMVVFDMTSEGSELQIVENAPKRIDRYKYKSKSEWAFKFWEMFWKINSASLSRGIILNSGNNPLLRETAAAMANKGYALRKLVPCEENETVENDEYYELVYRNVEPVLQEFLNNHVQKKAIPSLERIFKINLKNALSAFFNSKKTWEKELFKSRYVKTKAIMVNTLVLPSDMGIYAASKELQVPVISFQHGHSYEYVRDQYINDIVDECYTSDFVVGFSEKYFENKSKSDDSKKKISAGLPAEYYRGSKYRKPKKAGEDILFVSTTIYGNHHLFPLGSTHSDFKKFNFERNVINNVLKKIPHSVLYKDYLAQLFTENPRDLLQEEFSNDINFDEKLENLSFILPDHRILIVSRATSTLGWCLTSGKPVIFINFSDHYALSSDVEELFKEGIFIFNADDNSFFSDLHKFLSKSIKEIEAEWSSKKTVRKKIMVDILGANNNYAGKKAANEIERILNETSTKYE